MSYLKRQGGVTLVELVLVLAITAAAITSAIAVRSSLRKDISFTTSIEQVKNQILAAKTESLQTVKSGDEGGGDTSTYDFGRAVEFYPDDPATEFKENKHMRVSTLITEQDDTSGQGLTQKMARCDQRWEQYKDGVEYKGAEKRAIVFQRNPERIFVTPLNHNTDGGTDCSILATPLGDNLPNYGGYDSDNDGFPDSIDNCDFDYAPNSVDGCSDETPLPQSETCSSNGYQCGLYGRYHRIFWPTGVTMSTAIAAMRIVTHSAFNGEVFGSPYATSDQWLPILRYKAKHQSAFMNPFWPRVSARWTGQIRVPASTNRRFCLDTDDGSYFKVDNNEITNNLDSFNQQAGNRCGVFNNNTSQDIWLDTTIIYTQLDTTENPPGDSPFIKLYYKEGSTDIYVPGTDLRSLPGNVILPTTATNDNQNALRGEYFNNNSLTGSPYSVYTDSNSSRPPFTRNSAFTTDNTADTNVKQRSGQPYAWNFNASVRWTGQINLNVSTPIVCVNHDMGMRLKIAGIAVINNQWDATGNNNNSCVTLSSGGGWKNIEIETRTTNATSSFSGLGVTVNGQPASFRRSLDYTNSAYSNLNTSSVPPPASQNCSNIDDDDYLTYYRNGLMPGSNYKLDINYKVSWISPFIAPNDVCMKINGQLMNGGDPYSFTYDSNDVAANQYRTFSLDNITIGSDGVMDIKIGTIDQSLMGGWIVEPIEIGRVDLWRGFDSNGNLITHEFKLKSKTERSIVDNIFSAISQTAFAQAATCPDAQAECSILNYNNYKLDASGDYTFYPDEAEFEFGIEGSGEKGVIKVDPQTNSITREIDL